eukprot:TRINITY_DN6116_c0_g1_i1.p1 TRINITY_DN6116_c0_g1~~TRINITY_DN6116_c0_g1_i1.p1  ORF type:complete len:314 (-),score=41.47 TRINITY_DN6116_c0_g1_i1:353-1174(-)
MAEHKAFVSTPLRYRNSMGAKTQQRSLQGSSPAMWNGKPSMQVPRGAHNWFLGSAALLVATAAVAVQASQQRSRPTRPRRCVVACQAKAASMEQQLHSLSKLPIAVSNPLSSTAGVCLLGMPESTYCGQTSEPETPAPLASVFMAADLNEKVTAPTLRPATNKTHSPARFVAGVRLPASHRAGKRTNQRTAHSARRAVGARLVAKVQYQEVPKPSFDSSRVPLQIQAGVQSSSHVCVHHAREYKTPAAFDGGQAEHVLIKTSCVLTLTTRRHI